MRRVAWLSGIALGCMFFSTAADNNVAMTAEDGKLQDCRLIIAYDEQNMWNEVLYLAQQQRKLDVTGVKAELANIVDEHAKAKVDMIVHCIFTLPLGTVPPGFRSFNRAPENHFYQ